VDGVVVGLITTAVVECGTIIFFAGRQTEYNRNSRTMINDLRAKHEMLCQDVAISIKELTKATYDATNTMTGMKGTIDDIKTKVDSLPCGERIKKAEEIQQRLTKVEAEHNLMMKNKAHMGSLCNEQ
jgi:hypothetical protein